MKIKCQKCERISKKYIGKNDAEKKIIEDYNAVLCEFCGRAFVKHITKILSMDAIFTLPEDKAKM